MRNRAASLPGGLTAGKGYIGDAVRAGSRPARHVHSLPLLERSEKRIHCDAFLFKVYVSFLLTVASAPFRVVGRKLVTVTA